MDISYVEEMFKNLKEAKGQTVTIEYWHYGTLIKETTILKDISYYDGVMTKSQYIPFIGYGCAIKRISVFDGNCGYFLYGNRFMYEPYDCRIPETVEKAQIKFFGPDVVFKRRARRIAREEERKEYMKKADAKARAKRSYLEKKGLPFVEEGLKEEWSLFVDNNTKDAYSCAILETAIKCMIALSKGASEEEIEQILNEDGHTGFMVSCIIYTINHFTNLMSKEDNQSLKLK